MARPPVRPDQQRDPSAAGLVAGTEACGSVSPLPLLTVPDLARLLGVTARGARLVLERGELPGFRVGRRWYLRAQDLEAAIAEKVAAHARDRAAAVRILRRVPPARTPATSSEESP